MDNSNDNYRTNTGSAVATFAIILAIIALTVAWMAYNRSGKDLEDSVGDTVNSATENASENTQEGIDSVERGLDTGPDGVDDGAQ